MIERPRSERSEGLDFHSQIKKLSELTILSLIAACTFVKERTLDFQLRKMPQVEKPATVKILERAEKAVVFP
jgi:hypothetical protein